MPDCDTVLCTTMCTCAGDVMRNIPWTIRNMPWAIRNLPWVIRNLPWAVRTLPGAGVTEDCPCRTDFKEGSHVNGIFCNAKTLEVEAM
jgi:hypothetical protein